MVPYDQPRRTVDEMTQRATGFYELLNTRRSVRSFATDPVPQELVERAVMAASTAPSGAHRQPWTFVLVGDPALKTRIRQAAEDEETENYQGGRLPAEWREALAPLGTDSGKPYLEDAPWLVILFEQRYGVAENGDTIKNYYVKESVGIAAGIFVAAIHNMGLSTLTHTPSPMAFLTRILNRPENERPFALFPVGFPVPGCTVPDLTRKSRDDVLIVR
ncbi:MAG: nitroreductase family protein [bacterium]|nr:nitroreductase family protein [bacterium]